MTPQEKAKYLVNRMTGRCCGCPNDSKEAAKECVDEIIREIQRLEPICEFDFPTAKKYWQEVKTEIEKL